jgi:hypothetical protein
MRFEEMIPRDALEAHRLEQTPALTCFTRGPLRARRSIILDDLGKEQF